MVDRNNATVKYISSKLRKYSKEDIIYALVSADFTVADRVADTCEYMSLMKSHREEEKRLAQECAEIQQATDEYNALYKELARVGFSGFPVEKTERMLSLLQKIKKLAGVKKK